jgi:hypothetical protein
VSEQRRQIALLPTSQERPAAGHGRMAAMSDELVQIWSTGDAVIAELTKARLEDAGIDVLVKSSMGGSSAYPVGPSYLFVKADQEQDARAVIVAIESGEYAIDDDDVEMADQAPPSSDDA